MTWKKRRRWPTNKIISYLCTTCGIVFILGNVIMLQEGFVQLYQSTLGSKSPAYQHTQHFNKDILSRSVMSEYLYPRIRLPASALTMETRLRRLMENGHPADITHTRKQTLDATSRDRHVISVSPNDLRRTLSVQSVCREINGSITNLTNIGSGWTKTVSSGKYRHGDVAVKTVDVRGHDVLNCMQNSGLTHAECVEHASHKMLKEILLLRTLDHQNIVKVIAYCVPTQPNNDKLVKDLVSLVTELGEPLDLIKLLQMSWDDRLRISYGITKLLQYLAHSPFGSVVLHDFRRQQFVMVDGDIKLSDVDDMGFEEPRCSTDSDCRHYFSSTNFTLRTKCLGGNCKGFNEKLNVYNAARHFTTFLLPHGAPPNLRALITKVIEPYSNASWGAEELLKHLNRVVDMYASGDYLGRVYDAPTRYTTVEEQDLPGLFDYRCRYSVASGGCTVSVFDQREAEELCDADPDCQAFVISDQRTWSGRMLAHLKNNITRPSHNPRTNLYIKPTVL